MYKLIVDAGIFVEVGIFHNAHVTLCKVCMCVDGIRRTNHLPEGWQGFALRKHQWWRDFGLLLLFKTMRITLARLFSAEASELERHGTV